MADALDDSRPMPWVPGQGPFRVKGVAYRGHLEYVAENIPGGVEAMLAGFRDRRVADFFAGPFLAGTFYDVGPLVVAGWVCARLVRRTFYDFVRVRAYHQARLDSSGIYKVLLKLATPTMALQRLPAVQAQYLDFVGNGHVEKLDKQRAVLRREGLPELIAPWLTIINEAYIDVVLTAAGAKSVLTRSTTAPDAPVHGFPALKYTCEVTWQ